LESVRYLSPFGSVAQGGEPEIELARIVGVDAPGRIALRLGSERPYIPLAKAHLIHFLAREGHAQAEIARRLKCSFIYVSVVLNPRPERRGPTFALMLLP
jgi:hypothetical protein